MKDTCPPDTCPTQTVAFAACHECHASTPAIEAFVSDRRARLKNVIRLMRNNGCVPVHELKAVTSELEDDVRHYKLARTIQPCAKEALNAAMQPICHAAWKLEKIGWLWTKQSFWEETVPRQYQKTVVDQLPRPEIARLLLEIAPTLTKRGVLAFGYSGAGKTRTIFLLMQQLLMTSYPLWRFRYVEGSTIADAVNARSRNGGIAEFVVELTTTNALFIDDIGHGTFSASYAEALRRIVERCTSRDVPLFVTSQFDGLALLKQWTKDEPSRAETAKAIVRRLAEFCRPIRFAKPTERHGAS